MVLLPRSGTAMGFHVNESPGRLTSVVLNDVGVLQSSAADVLVDGVRESVTLVGLVVLAFYKDWRLASVAFTVLPILLSRRPNSAGESGTTPKKALKAWDF